MKPKYIADEIQDMRDDLEAIGSGWTLTRIGVSHGSSSDPNMDAIDRFMTRAPERIDWLISVIEAEKPDMVRKSKERLSWESTWGAFWFVTGCVVMGVLVAVF